MRIAPVSADLLIKLALGAAAIGVVVYLVRQAGGVASTAIEAAGQAVDAVVTGINPANPDNIVNTGVSAVGGVIVTEPAGSGKNADGSWSLGGWFFDVTHPSGGGSIFDAANVFNPGVYH